MMVAVNGMGYRG